MTIVKTHDPEIRCMPFQRDDVKANSIRMVNSLRESEFYDYRFKLGSDNLNVDSLGYGINVDGAAIGEIFLDLIMTGKFYDDDSRFHCFVLGAADYDDDDVDTQYSIILNPKQPLVEQIEQVCARPVDETEQQIARCLKLNTEITQKLIQATQLVQNDIDKSHSLSPDAKVKETMLPRGPARRMWQATNTWLKEFAKKARPNQYDNVMYITQA